MSLINEALKEARHEATRQDAIRQGGLYPRLPFHGPPEGRRRRWWIAIVVMILVAAGVGAGWWWRMAAPPGGEDAPEVANTEPIDSPSRLDTDLPTPPSRVPTATDEVSPAVDSGRPQSTTDAGSVAGSRPPAQPGPTTEAEARTEPKAMTEAAPEIETGPATTSPAPEVTEVPAEPVVGEKPAVAAESNPLPEAPQTAYVVPPPPPTDAVTFRREAQLKDGTRLSLGGIAWSPTQPVALINGRVMAVGEITEGFALREVRRDYVYLKRRDQVVILTLE